MLVDYSWTTLRNRLANRVQITTDGLRVYADAIENSFGADVDFRFPQVDRVLTFGDIVTIIDTATPKPGPRGPYKKSAA